MKVTLLRTAWVSLLLVAAVAAAQTVTVVNIIPQPNSVETNHDSEPNLAVDLANPLQLAATAFTPDSSGAMNKIPIYLSNDGGNTWTEASIIPVAANNSCPGSCDITLRFGAFSDYLYVGWLDGDLSVIPPDIEYNVMRVKPFPGPPTTDLLENIPETTTFRDQPYLQATSVFGDLSGGTGDDRVYVGSNDASVDPKSATIDQSMNAVPPPPGGLAAARPEVRTTCGFDGPPIRTAIHPNGTVYAVFSSWTACSFTGTTADVVVVRDDNWGRGTPAYSAISDTGDTKAGVKAISGVSIPFKSGIGYSNLGSERVGSMLSIAVDPTNSQTVYVAYGTGTGAADYTLNVLRSTTGGVSGSWTNVKSVAGATNPALAVNIRGTVGFLYQKLVTPGTCNAKGGATACWETHIETSDNQGSTWTGNFTVGNLPDTTGPGSFAPTIGDYDHLLTAGKDFYGIFSGFNAYASPVTTNFPQNVSYQRFVDGSGNLFKEAAHTTPVVHSVDPFFFHIAEMAAGDDFYVRDWTDSPTSGDTGVEPSTHPVFWATSDVWNRRGTLPGGPPFTNDQPAQEDAGNGAGIIGDNWAFARIRRNAGGAATTVTAHFLVSKFGTGSNYVDNTSADPDVTLDPGDPTIAFASGDPGPQITSAYHWHLNAIAGDHLCLAVEISTPGDPFIPPSLLGAAPGWTTGTDTRIVDDNNKAQRNMGLTTTPARGAGMTPSFCAIAHNAATFPRTMTLHYQADPQVLKRLGRVDVEVAGQDKRAAASVAVPQGVVALEGMQPAENRWLCVNLPAVEGKEGEILPVNFYEMVGNIAVNGFSVGVRLAPLNQVIHDSLELHRSAFTRMDALFKIADAGKQAEEANARLRNVPSAPAYLAFLKSNLQAVEADLAALIKSQQSGDPLGTEAAFKNLAAAVNSGKAEDAAVAHAALMNRMDAFLTMRQLTKGDVADILQMVRWQKELYAKVPRLKDLGFSREVEARSQEFIEALGMRKGKAADYQVLIGRLVGNFKSTAVALKAANVQLDSEVAAIEKNLGSLTELEKAHRDYLLKLQGLVK